MIIHVIKYYILSKIILLITMDQKFGLEILLEGIDIKINLLRVQNYVKK